MKIISSIAALTGVLLLPCAAAKTVTIDRVVDATLMGPSWSTVGPGPGFSLSPGDTLELTFRFLPGQRLLLDGVLSLGVSFNSADGVNHEATGAASMSFIGLSGPAFAPADKTETTGGYGFIAAWFRESFLPPAFDGQISLTGLTVSVTMLAYSDGALSRPYSSSAPFLIADAVAVVPEPASSLLLGLGLLPLGAALRWRGHVPCSEGTSA